MRPAFAALLFLLTSPLFAGPLGLVLPTENDAIFSEDPSQFYMYTNRTVDGVLTKPWQGGTYGFSRNQRQTSIGLVYTRFHEGVDIRPVNRDSSGNPLDEIRSMADGQVVHVNSTSRHSNYGNYVVVHHDWDVGPFFSLYAHLSEAYVKPGQNVRAGEKIAKMGYTGAGIDRERSHVHVELNMILSNNFNKWHDMHFTSANHHGIFNGLNLIGINIAELLKAHRQYPDISIPQFLAGSEEVYYKVLVPGENNNFLRRYPFLARDLNSVRKPKSWEYAFAASGVPLEIRPSDKEISYPAVTYVKPTKTDHSYLTNGRITGSGSSAKLTASGSRYMQLISDSF